MPQRTKAKQRGRAPDLPRARRGKKRPSEKVLKKPREDERGQLEFLAPVRIPGVKAGMPRHLAVINELRERAKQIGQSFMIVLRLCDELVHERLYERAGFETPQDLFEKRIPHLSWTTVRRYLSILEGVRRLPEGQREGAMEALQGIGVTKAGAIAPIIGKPGQGWQQWVERAKRLSEDDLRAAVQAALDAQGRLAGTDDARAPAQKTADSKWLDHTVHIVESFAPDAAAEIKETFDAGKKALGTDTYFGVLLAMVKEVKMEWLHEAGVGVSPAPAGTEEASA
jgi:hypothetical protein